MAGGGGHNVIVEAVSQRFGSATVLDGIDLNVAAGELVALLGPSGCGKSTLLRIVAGFTAQTDGRVLFDGQSVDHLGAAHRGVGIVFQNYALFPHMTVRQNVAYGLEVRKWPRDRIEAQVERMLDLVHMRAFADRFPRGMSGGQQQRVALARCLAIDPKVLLLDEPFGALDKNLRLDMQIEVKRLQQQFGITTLMVTHDQEEARSMADRIAVMNRGKIEQIASPNAIYDSPASLFVNCFVGSANILPGELLATDDRQSMVRIEGGAILTAAPAAGLSPGAAVVVTARPEQLAIVADAAPSPTTLAGTVRSVMPLGPQTACQIGVGPECLVTVMTPRQADGGTWTVGQRVALNPVSPLACRVFPKPESK
ncbi:MAG: ABC transporter ATP-binding protein [Sphingobium sp.]